MKRFILAFLTNALWLASIYLGFIQGMEGAKNIALFYAWVHFVFAMFATFNAEVLTAFVEKERPFPQWLSILCDMIAVAAFVWFGAWLTGAAVFIATIFVESA
jgi:hypothetical protein